MGSPFTATPVSAQAATYPLYDKAIFCWMEVYNQYDRSTFPKIFVEGLCQ
jgi:hypothetical protein